MTIKSHRFLSGAVLKHMAMASMLADHVNKAVIIPRLFSGSPLWLQSLSGAFSAFGRFAFPVFFFMLVEGFYHTKNRRNYLRNLLIFAFVSELPFDLFLWGSGLQNFWRAQNIYFTLALALGVVWLVDWARERPKYGMLLALLISFAGCGIAWIGNVDYGANGILIPLIFYLLRSQRLAATSLGYLAVYRSYWALPSFLLLNLYNGQRGKQSKWVNYWFYPAHLLILGMIRIISKI